MVDVLEGEKQARVAKTGSEAIQDLLSAFSEDRAGILRLIDVAMVSHTLRVSCLG